MPLAGQGLVGGPLPPQPLNPFWGGFRVPRGSIHSSCVGATGAAGHLVFMPSPPWAVELTHTESDSEFCRATVNALVSPSGMVGTRHLWGCGPCAQGVEEQHVDG